MAMRSVRVSRVAIVGMLGAGGVLLGGDDIDLGSGDAAAAYFAHFKAGADVEGGGCFCKGVKGNAGVHQGAEHHVAAYAGKTF